VFPALAAHASLHIGRVRAVLQVIPAACRQRCVQLLRPLLVGPSEPPDLIGPKVTKHRAERLPAADGVQELLPNLDREPLLRPGPAKRS
jgi:hypothetical protein